MPATSERTLRNLSPLCVYCGSASGADPAFTAAAQRFGKALASRRIEMIYGGGRLGLMGTIADAALEGGGRVTGVITRHLLDKELGHNAVHDLRVVDSMHQRKKLMADTARAFVALPGGVGTLDELFEILAWAQLGIHDCPIGLLNVNGFYNALLQFLQHATRERFMRIDLDHALIVDDDAERLLDRLGASAPLSRRAHGSE